MKLLSLFIMCLISLLLLSKQACSQQTGDKVSYDFIGHLRAVMQCQVNNGEPIEIHFGRVAIKKVESEAYTNDVKYTFDCGNLTQSNSVFIKLRGNPASWDPNVLASDVQGLGARVTIDGKVLEQNKDVIIKDTTKPPVIQTTLVKDPSTSLTEQKFSIAGELIIEYE